MSEAAGERKNNRGEEGDKICINESAKTHRKRYVGSHHHRAEVATGRQESRCRDRANIVSCLHGTLDCPAGTGAGVTGEPQRTCADERVQHQRAGACLGCNKADSGQQ